MRIGFVQIFMRKSGAQYNALQTDFIFSSWHNSLLLSSLLIDITNEPEKPIYVEAKGNLVSIILAHLTIYAHESSSNEQVHENVHAKRLLHAVGQSN